jgi:MerR family transcriptional regulator, thiopeptide resistance regulator
MGLEAGLWKVGELAERVGLSVRALHHYEEIGLLRPAGRTESGHRLYGAAEVLRLQGIASLRALGFSLAEIGEYLEDPNFAPERVVRLHVERLRGRIELERRLCERLEFVAKRLESVEDPSAEEFIETVMEVTKMSERVEKYYTPGQLETLARRREEIGEERIREVEAEWPELIAAVETEMQRGTDPTDERVQALARRWMELVEAFTGGDPGIRRSLDNVWQQEDEVAGYDTTKMRASMQYIGRAIAAANEPK